MTTMTTRSEPPMTREALKVLDERHELARQAAGRLRSMLAPSSDGRADPTRRQILEAKQQLEQAERAEIETALAVDDARLAYDAEQRRRRQAVVARCDRAVAVELKTLIKATDELAAHWARFSETCRTCDVEYLATGPLTEFGMPRYQGLAFPAFAARPDEPSLWLDFKTQVEGRGQ